MKTFIRLPYIKDRGFLLFIKARVKCIKILAVKMVCCYSQALAETLVMHNFSCTEVFYRVAHICVISKPKNIVVCYAGFLFCCDYVKTTASEIPVNFNSQLFCFRISLSDINNINQFFDNITVKMFNI